MVKQKYKELIATTWGNVFTEESTAVGNEIYFTLRADALSKLPEICSVLVKALRAHFVMLFANDERERRGHFFVSYVFSFAADDLFLILRVPIDARQREFPSITRSLDSATWFEREVQDWFGIVPFPNIGKLAVHPDWPDDVYPMVKDFDANQTVRRVKGSFDFKRVAGEGIFEIPVGPVHAGIIEPGHFRFSVAGEPIVNLDVQLFYTHKGTEKIAEGMDPRRAVFLAERISGDSSFSHALAFCHAVERMSQVEIPPRALVIRTELLELERIVNHISDVGSILLDVGFSLGASAAFQLKEKFMHLNEILTGSRLLRGIAAIGGVRRPIEDTLMKREALGETLRKGRESFEELVDLLMSSSTVLDRLETTGVLSHKDAYRLGVIGIAGRASGIDRDLRRDHPHCAYPHLEFHPVLHT